MTTIELETNKTTLDQKQRFFDILEKTFSGERLINLKKMYEDYGSRLLEAPASGRIHYHNSYEGGYLDHILHVYDASLEQIKAIKNMGMAPDFSREELTMATLHHDLWKLGLPGEGNEYYLVQDSNWHVKTLGEMYKHNEALPYMKVTDGALFILQKYNIPLTYNEYLGIKLSDGLYDDANKAYLMNNGKFPIHTTLPYIVHWADHMSTVVERQPLKEEYLNENN